MRLTDISHVNGAIDYFSFNKILYMLVNIVILFFLLWMLALSFIVVIFSSKNREIIVV